MASRRRKRRFHDEDGDEPELDARSQGPAWRHEVDLHGCTVESAQRRLLGELTRCRATRCSPVLVITGKGFGSAGGNGVLGPAMERWLKGPDGRSVGVTSVRAVRSGGALEVVLQRSGA